MRSITQSLAAVAVATVFAAAAAFGAGGIWSPIPKSETGETFVDQVNDAHSGSRPIEPELSCYPWGYLPTVVDHKVITCQHCAATNPCSSGTEKRNAVGVCDDDGTNCRWNCNQGSPPGSDQYFSAPLANDVTINGTPTTVLDFTAPLGASPTGKWAVDYALTATVDLTGPIECDIGLYIDSSSVPSRLAVTDFGTSVIVNRQTITLVWPEEKTTTTTVHIVAQATTVGGSACVLRKTGNVLAFPATLLTIHARPY